MSPERFRIGNLLLSAGTQEVLRNGKAIPLPPLSFNLLLTLARHAPNVVTTRELEAEVWSGLVVDRGTINKRVLLVRNALREAGCSAEYITVVRGTGYRIAVPVERIADDVDGADPAVKGSRLTGPDPVPRSVFGVVGMVGVVVVALALTFAIKNYQGAQQPVEPSGQLSGGSVDSLAPFTDRAIPSVAVLPFEVESGATDDAYLGPGIAREVTELLSEMQGLRVASSTSSFAFSDSQEPLASIAAQLDVRTLLKGSIRRFEDQIHVMASLIDVKSGYSVWSASFDRELADVYSIQDAIAANVAEALKVAVRESERPDSRLAASASVEAFTRFLRGRAVMDDRINLGVAGVEQALDHFIASTQADPNFVRAHVGIASAHLLLPAYDDRFDPGEHLGRAEASARYALELQPGSSEALGVLAAIMARKGESVQAAALFQRALELGNTDPNVLHWHAMLYISMGYFDELVGILDDAYRIDPLNPLLGCSLANALNLSGQPEAATRVFKGMIRFAQRDLGLALSSLYLGDYATAQELLRGIDLRGGALPEEYADLLVSAFAEPQEREAVIDAVLAAADRGELATVVAFESLLILGSPRAFELDVDISGEPFQNGLPEPVWSNWGVTLRQDPRFKEWIRELGYDQFWRQHGWPDRCKPTGLTDFECV